MMRRVLLLGAVLITVPVLAAQEAPAKTPPATKAPTTKAPATAPATKTQAPTTAPATKAPATAPATKTQAPTTAPATKAPVTKAPATKAPTTAPQTKAPTTAPATKATQGQGKAATKTPAQPPAPVGPRTRADSAKMIVFRREVFAYAGSGRRDPFASLIATGDIRPIFSDLVVAGIIYDPVGRNSVAMLQDVSTGELYRARVGSVFGRMRITSIRQRVVGVAIDEFGHTRQEVLLLNVPNAAVRTP